MNSIRTIVSTALCALALSAAATQASPLGHVVFSDNFDSDTPGVLAPTWSNLFSPSDSQVITDAAAPSPEQVLMMSNHVDNFSYVTRPFTAVNPTTTDLRFEFDINVVASPNANGGEIYLANGLSASFFPIMQVTQVNSTPGTWVPYSRFHTFNAIAGATLNMNQYYHFTLDIKQYSDPNNVDYTWTIDGVGSQSLTYTGGFGPEPTNLNLVIYDPTAETIGNDAFAGLDVRFDNVTLSTPEPASLGLLGMGGLILLRRRKA